MEGNLQIPVVTISDIDTYRVTYFVFHRNCNVIHNSWTKPLIRKTQDSLSRKRQAAVGFKNGGFEINVFVVAKESQEDFKFPGDSCFIPSFHSLSLSQVDFSYYTDRTLDKGPPIF